MDAALDECGASLVTGDTKVLERGALDAIIINTAGIGVAERVVRDNGLVPGDVIIVSGTIGDHGIAIMAHREGFDFGVGPSQVGPFQDGPFQDGLSQVGPSQVGSFQVGSFQVGPFQDGPY